MTRRGHPQTSHTHTSAISNFLRAPRHPIFRDHRLRMARRATYRCRWQDSSSSCAPYCLGYLFKDNGDTVPILTYVQQTDFNERSESSLRPGPNVLSSDSDDDVLRCTGVLFLLHFFVSGLH